MTRVWIAAGLAVLVAALAITEFNLSVSTSDNILKELEKTETSAKISSDTTDELCGDIQKLWDSKKVKLAMFLSHEEIDQISISIEKLARLSEQKNYEEFYLECGTLKKHIEGLKETELVNLHNIL